MKPIAKDRHPLAAFFVFCLFFSAVILLCLLISNQLIHRPAVFAPRAEDPSTSFTVVLDPGHGGEDGGTSGKSGVTEKELNLAIAKKLRQELEKEGIQVVMTRTDDRLLYDPNSDYQGKKKVQDLATRRQIAEQTENALFVSIHMNSYPDPQYKGLQTWYSENHPHSRILAAQIQQTVQSSLQTDNHRVMKPGNQVSYLLERLECPAVLVECGFLSNEAECLQLSTEAYQAELARVLCDAIQNYFSGNSGTDS